MEQRSRAAHKAARGAVRSLIFIVPVLNHNHMNESITRKRGGRESVWILLNVVREERESCRRLGRTDHFLPQVCPLKFSSTHRAKGERENRYSALTP